MEGNLYQRSSEKLIAPPQAQEERKLKARTDYAKEQPILAKILERLHQRVEFYTSVDSIECTNDPERFMHEVQANQRVVAILRSEISAIERLNKMFNKK